jgi:hypothetical protein
MEHDKSIEMVLFKNQLLDKKQRSDIINLHAGEFVGATTIFDSVEIADDLGTRSTTS